MDYSGSELFNRDEGCAFCNIEKTNEIVYKDEHCLAFRDKKPAAINHFLVIPRRHIKDCSSLGPTDLTLVRKMVEIGKNMLQVNGAKASDARFGFHLPPFNTIKHLHLHVIFPISDIGFIGKLIFKPNSYWFVMASSLIEKLEKMQNSPYL